MKETPNLFRYATSELSQDAFICWLLEWASPEFAIKNKNLHACGCRLIETLFKRRKLAMPSKIDKIEITKQDRNIDILCVINDTYALIIEDKTDTVNHSDQLKRYKDDVLARGFDDGNIIPVYFKTGDQSSYKQVLEENYIIFLREDFLEILKEFEDTNQIFVDYKQYLQSKQDSIDSYSVRPLNEWDGYSWIGFYKELQNCLGDGDWGYVANPSGGFQGFWWQFIELDDCKLYLQLEQEKLCFKIEVVEQSKRTTLRNHWHELLLLKSIDLGLNLVKPTRLGFGKWMTICVYDSDYRVTKNGILVINKTVEILRQAEGLLDIFKTAQYS